MLIIRRELDVFILGIGRWGGRIGGSELAGGSNGNILFIKESGFSHKLFGVRVVEIFRWRPSHPVGRSRSPVFGGSGRSLV